MLTNSEECYFSIPGALVIKMEGSYDGMYVNHTASKYNKWLERKEKVKKPRTVAPSGIPPVVVTTQKLMLSNNLKTVMVANFQCSQDQADNLWSKVAQDSLK